MANDDEVWPPPSPKEQPSRRSVKNGSHSEKSEKKNNVADDLSAKEVWPPVPQRSGKEPGLEARSSPSTSEKNVAPLEAVERSEADEVWPPKQSAAAESSVPQPSSGRNSKDRPPSESELATAIGGSKSKRGTHFDPRKRTNPVQAVSIAFRKYAIFSGRASRSEFWWFVAFLLVASAAISPVEILLSLFVLGTLLPSLAVTVRRLRDAGYQWPWLLLALVPLGVVVTTVLVSQPSRFGAEEESDQSDSFQRNEELQGGRIRPLSVEQRSSDGRKGTENTAWTFLAFLGSAPGLLARYMYLDSNQLWRNPFRQTDFAVVTFLFVFTTFGLGFVLTNFRWWGHSGESRFKKVSWLGVFPPIFGAIFVITIADWSGTGQTELVFPYSIGAYLFLTGALFSFALAAMAAVTAMRMSRRLAEEIF